MKHLSRGKKINRASLSSGERKEREEKRNGGENPTEGGESPVIKRATHKGLT